jgi:hypothetical protein
VEKLKIVRFLAGMSLLEDNRDGFCLEGGGNKVVEYQPENADHGIGSEIAECKIICERETKLVKAIRIRHL